MNRPEPVGTDVSAGFPDPRRVPADRLRGGDLVRRLNRVLPLGRKYHGLLRLLNGRAGFVAFPYEGGEVVLPKTWSKSYTEHLVGQGATVADFDLIAADVARARSGVLVDVGANFGLFSLRLRSISRLPLVCFEPSPFVFALLENNLRRNTPDHLDLRNEACGEAAGRIFFKPDINGHIAAPEEPGALEVPVVNVDAALDGVERVALLKIDCEGFEAQVLRGAQETLRRHRPLLFVELHPWHLRRYGDTPADVLRAIGDEYALECFTFQHEWPASRLGRSWRRFQRPRRHQYPSIGDAMAAAGLDHAPSQIYLVGRPAAGGG